MPDDFQIKAAIVTELVPPIIRSEDDSPPLKIPEYAFAKFASNDPFSAKLRGERTRREGGQIARLRCSTAGVHRRVLRLIWMKTDTLRMSSFRRNPRCNLSRTRNHQTGIIRNRHTRYRQGRLENCFVCLERLFK